MKENILTEEELIKLSQIISEVGENDKGQKLLNKITCLNCFVREFCSCLNTSNTTEGKTTTGKTIHSDYGYICDFYEDLVKYLKEEVK